VGELAAGTRTSRPAPLVTTSVDVAPVEAICCDAIACSIGDEAAGTRASRPVMEDVTLIVEGPIATEDSVATAAAPVSIARSRDETTGATWPVPPVAAMGAADPRLIPIAAAASTITAATATDASASLTGVPARCANVPLRVGASAVLCADIDASFANPAGPVRCQTMSACCLLGVGAE
jgi:hypothetical protein